MLKGFIFDLDGVLTDTATYHLAAWHELAQRLGITCQLRPIRRCAAARGWTR